MKTAPKKDTEIRARINSRIKAEATAILASIGLTPSAAFQLMMMKIAAEKALPFNPLVPNERTIEAMKAAQRGELIPVASPQDLFNDLDEPSIGIKVPQCEPAITVTNTDQNLLDMSCYCIYTVKDNRWRGMEIYIADSVVRKLKEKHNVSEAEVAQCFRNKTGKYLRDTRPEHQTEPPTVWFIASTDAGRRLKVTLMRYSKTEVVIKSAYEPNADEESIYQRYLDHRG